MVQLQVNLTASHYGHFEFRLCADKKSVDELVTKECLDKHLLQFEDGTTEFPILDVTTQFYYPRVQLPRDVNCEFCVMQWTYVTGILYNAKTNAKFYMNLNFFTLYLQLIVQAVIQKFLSTAPMLPSDLNK